MSDIQATFLNLFIRRQDRDGGRSGFVAENRRTQVVSLCIGVTVPQAAGLDGSPPPPRLVGWPVRPSRWSALSERAFAKLLIGKAIGEMVG
jgi:hypothetical protein